MNKLALLAAVSIALAGCAVSPGRPSIQARANNPQVYVVTPTPDPNKRLLVVWPDTIHFTPGTAQTIRWELDPQSPFNFDPKTGITGFVPLPLPKHNNQPSPPNQFINCGGGGKSYSCTFVNQQPGWYKYTINVTADDKNNPDPLDPIIGND